ncbi:hypothetical protein Agub_g2790, partial [Astrephomene gubernaculifera]
MAREAVQQVSFSRWLAHRARLADIILPISELLLFNTPCTLHSIVSMMCGPGPNGLDQVLPLHDHVVSHTATLLSEFPCNTSYAGQLAYVFRTGAMADPWVKLRACDVGYLGQVLANIITVSLALLAPQHYERFRNPLVVAATFFGLLSAHVAAAWVPEALLPLGLTAFFSAAQRRLAAVYYGWRAVIVHR